MKARAEFRLDCFYIAKNNQPELLKNNIHLDLVFHPPSRRKYDLDNALASLKSGLDGVAEAWGVNDSRFRPITIDVGEPIKGGMVRLRVM